MGSIVRLRQQHNRRCSAATQCSALHTVITVRIVARPCQRCTLLSGSPLLSKVFLSRPSCSAQRQRLTELIVWGLLRARLRSTPTLHQFLAHHPPCLFVSSLTLQSAPGFTHWCARESPSSLEKTLCDYEGYSAMVAEGWDHCCSPCCFVFQQPGDRVLRPKRHRRYSQVAG